MPRGDRTHGLKVVTCMSFSRVGLLPFRSKPHQYCNGPPNNHLQAPVSKSRYHRLPSCFQKLLGSFCCKKVRYTSINTFSAPLAQKLSGRPVSHSKYPRVVSVGIDSNAALTHQTFSFGGDLARPVTPVLSESSTILQYGLTDISTINVQPFRPPDG